MDWAESTAVRFRMEPHSGRTRAYRTTMLTSFSGTTITFSTVLPAMNA
jgi:hypothetical protein